MQKYFSASTLGFYDDATHGARTMMVPDPAWVRPTIDLKIQPGESYLGQVNETDLVIDIPNAPDMSVSAPLISVPNPNCKLPVDAIAVTDAQWQAALDGESQGKVIQADTHGFPVANAIILSTQKIIAALEVQVQGYIDSKAKEKGYDTAARCITYLNSTNATWKAEATAMNAWRDAVWMYCANLEQSASTPPTTAELIAELPTAPW